MRRLKIINHQKSLRQLSGLDSVAGRSALNGDGIPIFFWRERETTILARALQD